MKKEGSLVLVVVLVLFTAIFIFAQAEEDIQKHPSCKYCGMNRQQSAHSRMLLEYVDGVTVGVCSIHCIALDLALNIDKTPKSIHVGDYNTKSLIDAEKAYWVIVKNKMGVMTTRAKWAFGKKENAEKFKAENGGDLASFEQAIKASYEDMYADSKIIRERRKMKKMEYKHD